MAIPISVTPTEIPSVLEIDCGHFPDERGYFTELYCRPVWDAAGLGTDILQDNLSLSKRGTLRGMHYQLNPHGLDKFVRVLNGAVYDVAVDIREGSPTYGQWVGRELSAENRKALWIPTGFAHGFLALTDNALVLYKQTGLYTPEAERSLSYRDPDVGIQWPMPPSIVSGKDEAAPFLGEAEMNFHYEGG